MVMLVAASSVAAGQSSRPRGVSPVVTPGDAKQIVDDWYAQSYEAAAALDSALLAQVESPPLLTIDEADFQHRRDREMPFEELIPEPESVDVYVPRQTSHPAQFLARIGYAGGSTQYFVFLQEAEGAPWRTPYQAATEGFPRLPSRIVIDPDGYAESVPPNARGVKVAPQRLAAALVDYFSRYEEPRLPAARPFRAGPATSDNLKAIRARARDVPATFEFSEVTAPFAAYRTRNGGALVFFAYSSHDETTAPAGGTLRVDELGLPGPQLEPGRYVRTESTRTSLVAAAVPPAKQTDGLVTVVGRYTGTVEVAGEPAAPGAV